MELDLDHARAAFDASTDFTVGLEEEFALLHPDDLSLAPRFEELRDAAAPDPVLSQSIAGELISSEIEIRSGRERIWPPLERRRASTGAACSRWRASTQSRSGPRAPTPGRTIAASGSSQPTTTAASRKG